MILVFKHRITGEVERVQVNMPDPPSIGIQEDTSPASDEAMNRWEARCKALEQATIVEAQDLGWDLIPDFRDWH